MSLVRLEDHSGPAAVCPAAPFVGQIAQALRQDHARRRRDEAVYAAQQGRFSRPGGPEQDRDLTPPQLQGDLPEGGASLVRDADGVEGGSSPRPSEGGHSRDCVSPPDLGPS